MLATLSRRFHVLRPRILAVSKALRGNAGNATLELALAMSFFGTPLLLGTYETSVLIHHSIEVTNAAHAGALYGMMSSTFASDTSGIQTAAQNEASDFGSGLTVTPTIYYVCSEAMTGTQYTTQAAANTACPAGQTNHNLEMIQVATSASVTLPVHIVGLPRTLTLNGTSVMEVEE
jgi:Flp pilus assembly protein TadG